jgi:hypothetical protein
MTTTTRGRSVSDYIFDISYLVAGGAGSGIDIVYGPADCREGEVQRSWFQAVLQLRPEGVW